MAMWPTSGRLYQHGWPRRVSELSITSSATSSHACSHSMHQPSTANWLSTVSVSSSPFASYRMMPHSTTMRPRFIFPPLVLYSSMSRTHLSSRGGSEYIIGSSAWISSMSRSHTLRNAPFLSLRSYGGYSVVRSGAPAGHSVAGHRRLGSFAFRKRRHSAYEPTPSAKPAARAVFSRAAIFHKLAQSEALRLTNAS